MRTILVLGLVFLAALLPLAPPVAIFVLDVPFVVVAAVAPRADAQVQPLPLFALTPSRAPPSR